MYNYKLCVTLSAYLNFSCSNNCKSLERICYFGTVLYLIPTLKLNLKCFCSPVEFKQFSLSLSLHITIGYRYKHAFARVEQLIECT